MKKLLLILTGALIFTSCGTVRQTSEQSNMQNALTNDVSKLTPQDGWKEVVPGGYLRVTEHRRQLVAVTLEGFKWALEQEQQQLSQEQNMNTQSTTGQQQPSARVNSIQFLKDAIQQWDSKLSAQKTATIFPCTVSASAMGGSSVSAAKAYARTSCSETRQQSSHTTVSVAGGARTSSGNDQNTTYRLSSSTSSYLEGAGPCSSNASAGIVNQGYISDSYNQCYGSNGN
jgi:hypothetical protein